MNEGFLCVYQAYDYVIASGFKKLGSREERETHHRKLGVNILPTNEKFQGCI